MLHLWHLESVANKHQWSINRRSEVNAGAEHSIFAKRQRFLPTVANQRQAGLTLINLLAAQLDRLIEAVTAGRLQSILLPLLDDVGGRSGQPRASGFASFHVI